MVKCSCAGCNKKLRPGCHGTGGTVKNMCPTCMRAWHHLAKPITQRILHHYEYNRNKFQLIRNCAICGHLLNIWIMKKTRRVPDALWFSDELLIQEMFPAAELTKAELEYWECAICSKKDNDDYIKIHATVIPNI